MTWKTSWNTHDPGGVLRNAYVNKRLQVTDSEYRLISQAYNDYKTRDIANMPPAQLEMLKACFDKGIFSCAASPLPYPCYLDGKCRDRGAKTIEMQKKEPKVGVLAAGYMNVDNSTMTGRGIDVSGMTWDRPLEKGEIWVDPTGKGIALPTTNSRNFETLSLALLISVAIIFVICIIGIAVAARATDPLASIADARAFSAT